MFIIILFFMDKYKNIDIINKSNDFISKLSNLSEGNYEYNNGIISNSNIDNKFNIKGNGYINKDKYGNIKFYINYGKKCLYKSPLGNVKILNKNCNKFNDLEVKLIKNNSKISFTSLENNLEYLISNKDDLKGNWIKQKYNGNLIINSYNEGKNYIWFKDSMGNLSNMIEFEADCLFAESSNYNKDVFYCSGSNILLNNIEWYVIKDNGNEISLMQKESLNEKLPHCLKYRNERCYYEKDNYNKYNWDNSYINYYLNNVYINELDTKIKNKLIEKEICSDLNSECDNEKCIGYTKEYILKNNYKCNSYSKTKVRILSYDEYEYIYTKHGHNITGNNYWITNSFSDNKGSIIDKDNSVFILEELTSKNNIKPVITISKK